MSAHIKKARTGGAKSGPWWPCLLLLAAAAVALTATPHTALASDAVWAVTGCPALNPYTAGAPTNVSLAVTVNNVSSFAQRGGSGCVIAGAVTLVFKVEAMRALAVAARLPNVSIAAQDIVTRALGGAVPTIHVHVASSTSSDAATIAPTPLPLDLSIENISLIADLCAASSLQFVVLRHSNHLPAGSRLVFRDIHLSITDCAAARPAVSYGVAKGVDLGPLALRGGARVAIDNLTMTIEALLPVSSFFVGVTGDLDVDGDGEEDAPAVTEGNAVKVQHKPSTVVMRDVLLAALVKGSASSSGSSTGTAVYLRAMDFNTVTLRRASSLSVQRPRVVVQGMQCDLLAVALLSAVRVSLGGAARAVMIGGEVLVANTSAAVTAPSSPLEASVQVDGLVVAYDVALAEGAALAVGAGRLAVADCRVEASTGDSVLRLRVVRVGGAIRVSGSASLFVVQSLSSPPMPLQSLQDGMQEEEKEEDEDTGMKKETAGTAQTEKKGVTVAVRRVRVEGGSGSGSSGGAQLRVAVVEAFAIHLSEQAAVTVDGVTVLVDRATVLTGPQMHHRDDHAAVSAHVLHLLANAGSISIPVVVGDGPEAGEGSTARLLIHHSRVEVTGVTGDTITLGAAVIMVPRGRLPMGSRLGAVVVVRDVALVVAKSTLRGRGGVWACRQAGACRESTARSF